MTITDMDIDITTIQDIVGDMNIACEASFFHKRLGSCESPAANVVVLGCPTTGQDFVKLLLSKVCTANLEKIEAIFGIDGWICSSCNQIHTTLHLIRSIEPIG